MKRVLLVVGMVLAVGLFAVGCKKEEPVPVPPAKTEAPVREAMTAAERAAAKGGEAAEEAVEEVEEVEEKAGKGD